MISDSTLYSLSIFLGSLSMLLIVLYHFLEINAKPGGVDGTEIHDPSSLASSSSSSAPPSSSSPSSKPKTGTTTGMGTGKSQAGEGGKQGTRTSASRGTANAGGL
jgi:oligosaccharyl transferase complex subunit OST4